MAGSGLISQVRPQSLMGDKRSPAFRISRSVLARLIRAVDRLGDLARVADRRTPARAPR